MTDDTFEYILRHAKLPLGNLLPDGRTYRVTKRDFRCLDDFSRHVLEIFDKFLILTDGEGHIAGGVLFYDRYDIQAQMLPGYKGRGHMSAIHRNGILRAELYRNQEVSISESGIASEEDFNMKCHLLSLIGLKARNEDSIREEVLPLFRDGSIRVINISDMGGYEDE